jgi:hypothetical protein
MVVDNLNPMRIPRLPAETEAPLPVDPDAVLASSLPRKFLEMIGRGNAQVLDHLGGINHLELHPGTFNDFGWNPPGNLPVKQALRFHRC